MMSKNTIVLTLCALVASSSLAFGTEPAASGAAVNAKPSAMHHKTASHHLSKNDTIAVQNALAKAGVFKGKADGAWGTETTNALKEYQKSNSLKVTGTPDKDTLAKLGVTLSAPAPAAPAVSNTSKTPR